MEKIRLPHPDRAGDFLVKDVSFSVARGEVLGLFGLMGAGRSELFETIFGLHAKTSWAEVFLEGREITSPLVPRPSRRAWPWSRRSQTPGPGDEHVRGGQCLPGQSRRVERFGFLSDRLERASGRRLCGSPEHPHGLAPPAGRSISAAATSRRWSSPSGWRTEPKVLLLDEPTRGIDVNAKNQIYQLIHELAPGGPGHRDDLVRDAGDHGHRAPDHRPVRGPPDRGVLPRRRPRKNRF